MQFSSPWLETLSHFTDCLALREPEWWSVYSHPEVIKNHQKRHALYWLKYGRRLETQQGQALFRSVAALNDVEEQPAEIRLSKAPSVWPGERLADRMWCIASADLLFLDPNVFWVWCSARWHLGNLNPKLRAAEITLQNLQREYPSASVTKSWHTFLAVLVLSLDQLAAQTVGVQTYASFLGQSKDLWPTDYPPLPLRESALTEGDPAFWLKRIRGSIDIFSLDVGLQVEWQKITHIFLAEATCREIWHTPAVMAYLEVMGFQAKSEVSNPFNSGQGLDPLDCDLADYLCMLLLDLLCLERDTGNLRLASLCQTAHHWGLLSLFQKWFRQEWRISKREWQVLWEAIRSDVGGLQQ
ncbi:MAG: hypothetical protein H6510_17035 [Acidobacteria bacterium]|nr:hypothetical protein [Acidobacteriota bacterium]MCB9399519.1 hypothetical protein [Acidobacteriota bacterium]